MNPKILNIAKTILFILLILSSIFLILSYLSGSRNSDNLILHDTTIVTRYKRELIRDTVIKWYEKVKYIRNKPEEIRSQKADSIIAADFKDKDLMFKIDKVKDNMIIKTLNSRDSLIKEYHFSNTGRDFSLISQKNNIYLKSKLFYFSGINLMIGYDIYKDKELSLAISSGINWRERIYLEGFAGYNFHKRNINTGIHLNIKILK
ncbi:MAG TPA: hypothetical protein VIL99_13285 [Ignavibacteria bacterium]